jgi:hypothetical protein
MTDDRTTHVQTPATFMAKLQSFIGFFFSISLWYMNQSMSTKLIHGQITTESNETVYQILPATTNSIKETK